MNVIQEAQMYQELLSQGVPMTQIARDKQVALGTIAHRLAWLELPVEVQKLAADGSLSRNVRVAKALARLPREYQISEAKRFARSGSKIAAIEKAVDRLLDQLMVVEADRYGRLSDGRPFLAVILAERSVNGTRFRKLSKDAVAAARRVCDLCSLQPNISVCQPCPLVTMLSVLIRKK